MGETRPQMHRYAYTNIAIIMCAAILVRQQGAVLIMHLGIIFMASLVVKYFNILNWYFDIMKMAQQFLGDKETGTLALNI